MLEAPTNGYLVDDTIVIRYEIELVVTSGGALNRITKSNPHSIDVTSFPTLGDQMRTLLTDDADTTDCVFEVEGERFEAHSLVMSARSSTFRAMLRTGAEMREGSDGVMCLRDIRAPVFRHLLYFIYTDSLPDGPGDRGGGSARRGRGAGASAAGGGGAAGNTPLLLGSSSEPYGVGAGGGGEDCTELDVAMTQVSPQPANP